MQCLDIPLDLFDSFDDFFFKNALALLNILVFSILTEKLGAMVDFLLTEVIFLGEGFHRLVVDLEILFLGPCCYAHFF